MEIKLRTALGIMMLCCGFQCFQEAGSASEKPEDKSINRIPARVEEDIFLSANNLSTRVRDGSVSREAAMVELNRLKLLMDKYYAAHAEKNQVSNGWIFPVKGYNSKAIGGKNGSGYLAQGYNFFDGNRHKGHPAHDIFIQDKNQDHLDDATGKPVYILSVSGGVVFAAEPNWDTLSDQRGGKYLWIYAPAENAVFYYAHNDSLLVKPGDIVKPGDQIAIMGRSGTNAFKKRSPTHLHFSFFTLLHGIPQPVNCYPQLLKARSL